MRKPIHAWLVFGAVALVAVLGFAWMSRAVLRVDEAQRRNAAMSEREERIRLALWRIDSAVALLLAGENARGPYDFQSFHPPAQAWTRDAVAVPVESLLLPSPLLELPATPVRLHFEFPPGGPIQSPQIPPPDLRALAESMSPAVPGAELAVTRLATLESLLGNRGKGGKGVSVFQLRQLAEAAEAGATNLPSPSTAIVRGSGPSQAPALGQYGNQQRQQQQDLNRLEQQARVQTFNNFDNTARNGYLTRQQLGAQAPDPGHGIALGRFVPVWIADELLLVRRADLPDGSRVQGVWLDWPALRTSLADSIADLVPAAKLVPSPVAPIVEDGRLLASLPVRLEAGTIPTTPGSAWTALRLALVAAWVCLALAAIALAILLHGVLALSERRAEFVSAVTHELRTPLTTFRLYSEMLAGGMVTGEEQRRGYLSTLCAEADRLGHLVENVLAYARLERGSARNRAERITLSALVDRVQGRLRDRAALAGMEFEVDLDPATGAQEVQVDVSAVEQILFNLVDNAAKYGANEGGGGRIHLEGLPERGKFGLLRVRDQGRGLSPDVVERLFEPFHRSAEKAAGSAPGVGLGLALCRKLSRSLGGELRLDRSVPEGAAFVLSLPVSGE